MARSMYFNYVIIGIENDNKLFVFDHLLSQQETKMTKQKTLVSRFERGKKSLPCNTKNLNRF